MKAQDTSGLFFADVRVPPENMLGGEGQGFFYLMQELAWERLQIAIMAVAGCEAALKWTTDYVRERKAFGRSEEHTSELQSLMRISYAVFCLKKKNRKKNRYKSHQC